MKRGAGSRRSVTGEPGQLAVFVVFMIAGLLAMSALVLDVGSWYREHRRLQSVADAAALAGAHALPYDTETAVRLAYEYAQKNAGPPPEQVVLLGASTIAVVVRSEAPGFLARFVGSGIDRVDISAAARASALLPSRAIGAVPIIVSSAQEKLSACGGPCTGSLHTTSLPVNDDATAGGGQMGLVDLREGGDGSVTAGQIADWVRNGLSDPMRPDRYYTAAGSCKFSNQNFHEALNERIASQAPLLFPVYDPARTDTGSNPPRYYIVGWAAFVVTDYQLNGCGSKSDYLRGYFVNKVVQGYAADEGEGLDFGVRVIALVG